MSEWIKCSESMPNQDENVLCSGFNYNNQTKGRWVHSAYFIDGYFYSHEEPEEEDKLYHPTHWMQLPEPPK